MSLELLERLDDLAPTRNMLKQWAAEKDEWSGFPMPLEDMKLVIENKHPYAAALMSLSGPDEEPEDPNFKIRNTFWSWRYRSDVAIVEMDGKITFGLKPGVHHLKYDLHTCGASVVWGIEQESNALQLLATMLPHHAFKKYLLTGMFIEGSRRSRVSYMFRRLKPTIAMVADNKTDSMKVLSALCMHPIGYYEGTWAGAMCPTDDVIAHLTLMRANEHLFWRRCNQHPSWRPEAGI